MHVVVWTVVMDPGSFSDCGKPLANLKTGRQILVLDFDGSHRLFCCHFIHRSHRDDGVSNKSDPIDFKRIFIFTDWENSILHREIFSSDNRFHSGHCLGFGSVNTENPRMGSAGS